MRRLLISLMLILLPLGLWAQVGDDDGPGVLARFLQNVLSEDARQVNIRGFQGALSTRATIRELTIADEQGEWVIVRRAVIDWDRSALLSGRLIIQELSAGEIEFLRQPMGEETLSPEASGLGLPNLPVSISIDRLATQRVILREPVYGTPAVISVNGSVSLDGGSGAADLAVLRLDQPGEMALDADYSRETGLLNVDFVLAEEANGIAANALRLPGRPSVNMAVRGNAPWDDFSASIILDTDGQRRLSGIFATYLSESSADADVGRRFRADLSGDVAPIFAPQYRDFFGDQVALEFGGFSRADGSVNVDSLSIAAGEIALDGSLDLGPDRVPDRMVLRGRVAAADGSQVLLPLIGRPTRVRDLRLDVDFDADRSEAWSGEAVMRGFERPSFSADRLSLIGGGTIRDATQSETFRTSITAGFDFEAVNLDLGNDSVQQVLGETVAGRMELSWEDGQPVILRQLRLDGADYGLDIVGEVAGVGRDLRLNGVASLDARDLSDFSGLAGRPITGSAQVNIAGNGGLLGGEFDVIVTGTAQDLTIDQTLVDRLLQGGADLRLHTVRDVDGTRIEEFSVTTEAVDAQGSGVLRTDATEVMLTASLADSSLLLPGLNGPIVVEGSVVEAPDVLRFDVIGTGPESRLTALGTLSGVGAARMLDVDATLLGSDLSILSEIAHLPITGSAELEMSAALRVEDYSGTVALSGQGRNLSIGNARLDPILTGASELVAELTLAPGDVRLDRFEIASSVATVSATGQLRGQDRAVSLDAELVDAGLIVESLSGPIRLTGDVAQAGPDQLQVDLEGTGPSLTLTSQGILSDLEGVPLFTGQARLSSRDVSVFSALGDRDLSGAAELNLDGAVQLDGAAFDLAVSGTGTDLRVGHVTLDRLAAGPARLTGQLRREGTQLELIDGRFDSAAVTLTASGQILPEATELAFEARLKEAALLLDRVDGAFDLGGTLTQTGPDSYDLNVAGTGAGADLAVDGVLTTDASGDVFDGSARIDVAALDAFSQLTGRPMSGALEATANGSAALDGAVFALDLDGTANDLRLGIPLVDRLFVGPATFTAALERDAEALTVTAFDVRADRVSAQAQGRLAGSESDLRFGAEVDSAALSGAQDLPPVSVIGRVAGRSDGSVGVELGGTGPGARLRAEGTITDSADSGKIAGWADLEVQNLAPYSALAGRDLAGSLSSSASGTVSIDFTEFDFVSQGAAEGLKTGNARLDRILAGRTEFRVEAARQDGVTRITEAQIDTPLLQVSAEGRTGSPGESLRVSARLRDIAPFISAVPGPATAEGTLTDRGDHWSADLDVRGPQGIAARVTGLISPNGARYEARGTAPLDLAEIYLGSRSLTGLAAFDLAFDGDSGLSGLSGTVSGQGARVFAPKVSLTVNDIAFHADIGGGRALVRGQGHGGEGGTVSVAGDIALFGRFPGNLTIGLDAFGLREPGLYTSVLNGVLHLNGPVYGGGHISGRVTAGPTVVTIPSTSLGERSPLPVIRHLNEPAEVRRTRVAALLDRIDPRGDGSGVGRAPPFTLDIQVDAPDRFYLRGLGLDSEFGGAIRLGGTALAIEPRGQLGLRSGRFDFLGRQLTLTQGALRLEGEVVPRIRVRAELLDRESRLAATLQGRITDMDLSFDSFPDLPEDQIIARLVFREQAERLTLLQAARLASVAAQLGGDAAGGAVVRDLRDKLRVDYLDLAKDPEGGGAVRAGKELAPDTYGEVTVGENASEVRLRVNLSEALTVQGAVDTDGESRLGLFFEMDY